MTISGNDFWEFMVSRDYTFFAGVPDSTFGPAYNALTSNPHLTYIPATREDSALGVASAAYFSGQKGAVVMQNSGLGNVINPLTSFSLMYEIPILLIIGWRGFGGPDSDAPEHWIMGEKTPLFLELLNIPYAVLDTDLHHEKIDELLQSIEIQQKPGALLVPPGVFN